MKRLLVLALAVAIGLSPALVGTPLVAAEPTVAAAEGRQAQVLVDQVLPSVPKANSVLRIRGRIANTGSRPLADPVVQLRLSPDPLHSRSEVAEVLDGSTERRGLAIPNTQTTVGDLIQPGQQVEFRTRIPMADLGLSASAGVYAVFVELVSESQALGRAGTVIPWFPKGAEFEPSGVAMLWPMTQVPSLAANELVLDAALPEEFAPGGRLDGLLTLGSQVPVSWLVDSAMVETATSLADGYRVLAGDGPQPGDKSEDAKRFMGRLARDLTVLPVTMPGYAIADADALLRVGLTSFVVRSTSLPRVIGASVLEKSELVETFLAPGGRVEDDTLKVLIDAGIRKVIVSDRALPPTSELNYTPTGAATIGATGSSVEFLLTDRRLSATLAHDLSTSEDRSAAKQAFLADLAMITLERPNEPRNVVALPPLIWDPPADWTQDLLKAVQAAPWINLIQLGDVNSGPLVERSMARYRARFRAKELPVSYVKRIAGLESRLESMSRIVDDPGGFGEGFTLALQRASSGLWRKKASARNRFLRTISHQLDAEKQKVRVVSTGNVTLAGENGILPLTVANDLDRDVTVAIQLKTANQIRLLYDPPEPITVQASQKAGLEVPVQVLGNQPMEVSVVLTDREGNFYDDSATLQLQSTASTRIAAIVAGVGALAFVILVVVRLIRRRRGA